MDLMDLKLPSGKVAKIVPYFTRGDDKFITKERWGGATVQNKDDGTVEIQNIPVDQADREDDAVVFKGAKFIDDKEVTMEVLDELESKDFLFLLNELKKTRAGKKK